MKWTYRKLSASIGSVKCGQDSIMINVFLFPLSIYVLIKCPQLLSFQYWKRVKREFMNFLSLLIPWEMRIKLIESRYNFSII